MSASRSLGVIASAAFRPRATAQLRCLPCVAARHAAAVTTAVASPTRSFATSSTPRPPQRKPSSPTAPQQQRQRAYHSADHPPAPEELLPFSRTERALLSAAYAHVPEHGFSDRALVLGARDAGLPDISTTILPGGAFALVRWHLVTSRRALEGRAAELFPPSDQPLTQAAVNNRAELLTWERLLANEPVIGRWQEALAIMAQPSLAPEALRELTQLADDIWFLAGDTAVDPSWYAKRAALSATYAAAELAMTTDRSAAFADTREFLARRFAEAAAVSAAAGSVGQWLGFTAGAGVNVLRSKGVRI